MVEKAITCEESNAGKRSGPNINTGTGNFPHYFALRPSLVSPASMGPSELQRALRQLCACSLQPGFANQHSGHPCFISSPSLSPHPLAVHHPSCGGSTATPLPCFLLRSPLLYTAFCPFHPDFLSKPSQPDMKLCVGVFPFLAVSKLRSVSCFAIC